MFKIKRRCYLRLLMPETMKLLGSNKSKITKDNIVNNNYQQDSRVLYTFIPNKSFGQVLDISKSFILFLQNFQTLKYDLLIKILNR